MSQQAGSAGGPMLNVPYAYFYGGNMMPGSFQYGTPAIYPVIIKLFPKLHKNVFNKNHFSPYSSKFLLLTLLLVVNSPSRPTTLVTALLVTILFHRLLKITLKVHIHRVLINSRNHKM